MKSLIILLMTSVFMITCGSDNADVVAGKYRFGGPVDPWEDVGEGALPTDGSFTDDVRVLEFGDGMRISYDRTDPGDEEVCREDAVGGHRYGVCMSLVELDTSMEDSSVLWPLLVLESFSGRIDCTIDGNYKDCDTEVFPHLGGGENFCQSGVINGDKALVCEDDWAVVANGENEQIKTVCRVHLSDNSGRCLGAPKTATVSDGGDGEVEEPVPTEELILKMQRSSWQGYRSENINPAQVLENDNLSAEVVAQLPTDAELSYKSLDEGVCTLDNDGSDGNLGDVTILSGVAPDVCEVSLTISAPNFVDRVIVAEMSVVQANDTAWTGYAASPAFYVGEVRSAQAPTSTPASATLVYRSQDEAVCTVDEDSGDVTGVSGGDCVVVLNSSQDEYLEVEIESTPLTVTPAQSFTSLAWAGFPTSGTVGTDIDLSSNLPVSQPAADTYEIAIVSGDCTWDDSGKMLAFQDTTACTVRATARKRGYEPQTLDRTLTPAAGTFAITWTPATAAAVGGELVLDAVAGAPNGAVIAYTVKNAGTTGCAFKGTSGADVRTLLFSGVGTCTVTASASLTGYTPWTSSDVAINVLAGALGNITWGSFTGDLQVGGARKAPSAATGTGLTGATVTYALKDGSQTNCDLTNTSTGEVEAKAVDLTSTKTCTVVGTATRTGYAPATQDISINLSAGTLGTVTWGTFSGTLEVGGTVQTPSAATGSGLTGATVSYSIKSGSETNCELTSANTGAVQAKAVDLSSTQTCTIVGSVTRTGYTAKTGEISINLSVGTMGDLSSPAYTGTLAVMGTLVVTTQPSGAPDGASWSYTVAGERSGSAQSGICTINAGTGAVSATASAVAGDFCIVTARASALGYTAKDAPVVRLQVSAQEALTITWTGYTPSSLAWASGGVTSPTLNTSTVTDTGGNTINVGISRTYSVGDATTNNSCTVNSSSGVLTISGAGICEIVLTVADNDDTNEESYATSTKSARVTIAKGAQSITIPASPYGASPSLKVGGSDLMVANEPTGGQTSLTLEYQSADTSVCTVDSAGTVSPVATGTCTIQARRAGNNNFSPSDWEDMITLTVGAGTFTSLSRGGLPGTGTVGVNIDLSSRQPVSVPVADSYAISTTSADCAYTGTILSFSGTTECVVQVIASKTDYTDKTETFRITVSAGALGSITWGSFTGDLVVGGSPKTPSQPTGAGISGATISYAVKTGSQSNCDLNNANTGQVTAKAVDLSSTQTCTIVGTASRDGYTPTTGDISINLALGTMGALTAPTYSGSLAVGGTLSVSTGPSGAPDGAGWSYTIVGQRSGSDTNGICTIDEGTGSVSATTTAVAGDICIVTARASATGYNPKDAATVSLTVSAREALTITWTGYSPSTLTWTASGVSSPDLNSISVSDSGSNGVSGGISKTFSEGSGTTNSACTVNSGTGTLTINGAGTCEVVLTVADSDPNNEESYATQTKKVTVTINKGTQIITVGANPYGASPTLNVGGSDLSVANEPTGGQSSLDLEYQSISTSVCTVASGTGTVSPVATGTCTIQARRVGDDNFAPSDWTEVIELEVGQGTFASLTWDSFPTSGTVGVDISLSDNRPVSSPVADDYTFIISSGGCSHTGTALRFSDTTECVVQVTASKTDYAEKTATFRVTPGAGTLVFATVPTLAYSGDLKHGDRTTSLTPSALSSQDDNSVEVTWSYQVSGFESNGSTVKANVCVLSGSGVQLGSAGVEGDICQISVRAQATGYSDYTGVSSIRKTVQKGVITGITWSPQTTGTVGTDLTLTAVGGNLGSDTVTYTKVSGSCSLSGRVVTFSSAGNCVVKATVARAHYVAWDSGEKTIAASAGTITFASTPTLSYSGSLSYGDTTTKLVPSGLPASDTNSVSITWHYTLQGRNSDDTGDKANVCSRANANSGYGDYNKIQLGSAALAGDICRISVTGRATAYGDYTTVATVDLTVGLGTQSAPTGWSNHYGASPEVRVGETLPVAGTEPTNSASDGGALEYNVKSGGTHCSVNSSSGEVRGSSVGSCVIQARFVAVTNKYGNSPWVDVATITVQSGSQAYTWSQSAATVTFGSELALSELTGAPAGATVNYQIVDGANSAGCSWKGSSGVNERTLTFSDDGSCMVRVEVTRIGYNTWSSAAVAITVSPASWTTAPAWTGYAAGATFNATPPALTSPTSTPDAAWTYATSTGTVCDVDEGTGTLTIRAAGDCIVTATPDKAGYGTHAGIEQTVRVAKAAQNAPSGWSNPYGSNPSLAVGAAALSRSGSVPGGQGALEYQVLSTHNAHCSVVGTTGEVTAKDAGAGNSCTIQARFVGNGNYNPSDYSNVATISIISGTITLTWTGYTSSSLTWSESLTAPTAQTVSVTPTDADLSYTSSTTTICTVASTTDPTLTILRAGTCTIRVTASKTGYTSVNRDATVTIDKAANPGSTATVDAYAATVAVGTPVDPSGLPSDGQGGLKYRVRNQVGTTGGSDSTHCSVNASGQVSAASGGVGQTCYIQARWKSNDNYNSSDWFNISGADGIDVEAGSITLSWGAGYGTDISWAEYLRITPWELPMDRFSVTPTDASVRYSNRTPTVCTVASNTDPTLTLLKAGTCTVRATATKPGYTTVTADETFVINPGNNPGSTNRVNAYANSVAVGSPIDPTGLPTNGQGGLEYRVWNQAGTSGGAASTHCSVEQSNGRVSGNTSGVGQTCHIHARWKGNDNYRASVWFKVSGNNGITVNSGSQSYSWGQSAATATFGSSLNLTELTGPPQGSTITYRIATGTNSAGCTISGRTLSFADDGSCRVEVHVTRTGYQAWTSPAVTITVSPASWTTAPDWTGYAAGATFNATPPTLTSPTSTPDATWTYATSTGTVCGVNENSGALTIKAAGDCIVTATPSLAGYGTHAGISQTIAIARANQNAPSSWSNPYGANPSLAVGASAVSPSGTLPGGQGALSYQILSTHNANCTVVSGTGAVTATVAGAGKSCTVQARFLGNGNYNPSDYSNVATISIVKGTIVTTWRGYGTSLTWDEGLRTETLSPLASVDVTPSDAQVSYSNQTPLLCTIASSTNPTLTILKAGECMVGVSATKPGYTTDQISTTLLVDKAANPGTTTVSDAYANSVAVGSPITPTGLPTNGQGGLEYRVHDGNNPTSSSTSTDCIVEQANGRVSGASGSTGQTCYIHARWKGNDHYLASGWFNISGSDGITVAQGSQSYSWGQAAASATFGTELLLTAMTGTPAGAGTSYRIVSTGNSASCAWKGSSGNALRTLTFGNDGSCQVEARVTQTGYSPWTSPAVTITVNPASWTTAPAWTGYSATVTFNSPAPAITAPTSNPAATWTYESTTTAVCTVNNSGVLSIVAAGSCSITATPSLAGYGTRNHAGITQTFTIERAAQNPPSGWTNPYGANPSTTVGGTNVSLDTGSTAPTGQGALEYQVKTGSTSYCTVGTDGTVAPDAAGDCTIEARFAGNTNYRPSPYADIATISVVSSVDQDPAITQQPVYSEGTNLYKGGGNMVTQTTPIVLTGQNGQVVTNHYCAHTISNASRGICSIPNSGLYTGEVVVGNDARAGDTCQINISCTGAGKIGGQGGSFPSTSVTFTVQPAITFAQLNTRILTPKCLNCHQSFHSSWTSNANLRNSLGRLNLDPTQAKLWKRVQKAHDSSVTTSPVMPPSCTGDDCLSVKDVEYVASFLRGGTWQPEQSISAPTYTEGTNLFEGSGNQVWIVTEPEATESGTSTTISGAIFRYSAVGKRGSVVRANICSIRGNNGRVTVGSAAIDGDTCEITITSTATGYQSATTTHTLTVQSAITYAQLNTRVLGRCTSCHGSSSQNGRVTTNANLRNAGWMNTDPTQAKLWKSVQRAHDSTITTSLMPQGCSGNGCLSVKDVEYVASFLRGGDWQSLMIVTPPVYSEGSNLYEGSGNQVWIATAPRATNREVGGQVGYAVFTYSAQGVRGGVVTSNICSINSSDGRVTVGSAAVANDTCEITVKANAHGYAQNASTARVILTVQPAVTLDDIKGRFLTSSCMDCHNQDSYNTNRGNFTSEATMRAHPRLLNTDPASASLWKRIKRAHLDTDDSSYGGFMPSGCSRTNLNSCVSEKNVEYVASFLRGGDWQE